jgi:hypothetical protein
MADSPAQPEPGSPEARRHIAAKGLVTRARNGGSAEEIAAAEDRESEAYAEFRAVRAASIGQMFATMRGGSDRFSEMLGQIFRAWDADAAALTETLRSDREAGQ